MAIKSKNIICSGKRKTSVARAMIVKGKGVIRINKLNLNSYGNELARMKIMEPLILAGDLFKSVDIKVNVKGGGWQSQAEAARLAIAKAIVEYFKKDSLKNKFLEYDRNLLVADIRRTEPQKPYRSAARTSRQMSKR
ncbi:MAG: 30S ribosomal protein S9 [Candidatus Nanoarchaeia archaeon]|nr:30S ribosomal protein S9 [Candidatus Nanoarchaeia archaeon]MDD5054079.1 30S ribosomal protein S9 [Candidatus Nanoarchaeia archaeon]MDD5499517.1 30S ribosomal protein S9 [Candidatus Nanoarchaeia archaeon]